MKLIVKYLLNFQILNKKIENLVVLELQGFLLLNSMGKEVTMFFTFWGLNILKSKNKPKVNKDTMEKMFDIMLPGHPEKLPLSKMNMMGMGPAMIKQIMKKHNVDDLESLITNAINMGVKVVACAMSMDLMGIKKEEFIDGVEIGGVASYLGATEDSGLNLFI